MRHPSATELATGTITALICCGLWRRGARRDVVAAAVVAGVVGLGARWCLRSKRATRAASEYDTPKEVARFNLPKTSDEWVSLFERLPSNRAVTLYDAATGEPAAAEVTRIECALNGLKGNLRNCYAWLQLGFALLEDSYEFNHDTCLRSDVAKVARAKQRLDDSDFDPRDFLITSATVPEVGEVFADDCFKRCIEIANAALQGSGSTEQADVTRCLRCVSAAKGLLVHFVAETDGYCKLDGVPVDAELCMRLAIEAEPDFPPLLFLVAIEMWKADKRVATLHGKEYDLVEMIPAILDSQWTERNPEVWRLVSALLYFHPETQSVIVHDNPYGAADCLARMIELRPTYEAYHCVAKALPRDAVITVNGQRMNTKQLLEAALGLNKHSADAWLDLSERLDPRTPAASTATVDGVSFTQVECVLQALSLDRQSAAAWQALLDALHPEEPTLVFGVPTRRDELPVQALEALGYDNARGWDMLGQVIRCRKLGSLVVRGEAVDARACLIRAVELSPPDEAFKHFVPLASRAMLPTDKLTICGVEMTKFDILCGAVMHASWNAKVWVRLGFAVLQQGGPHATVTLMDEVLSAARCFTHALTLSNTDGEAWLGLVLCTEGDVVQTGERTATKRACLEHAAALLAGLPEPRSRVLLALGEHLQQQPTKVQKELSMTPREVLERAVWQCKSFSDATAVKAMVLIARDMAAEESVTLELPPSDQTVYEATRGLIPDDKSHSVFLTLSRQELLVRCLEEVETQDRVERYECAAAAREAWAMLGTMLARDEVVSVGGHPRNRAACMRQSRG
jgi:hypothetical protein